MSAAEVLEARTIGISIGLDGDDLVLEASGPPSRSVLERLKQHKFAIVAFLPRQNDCWTAENWQAFFQNRAAAAQSTGGLPREKAEEQALACCVAEWLNRNPPHAQSERAHSACWPAWHQLREVEAITVLAAMGIGKSDCTRLHRFPDNTASNISNGSPTD